jgi:hypothetical protein
VQELRKIHTSPFVKNLLTLARSQGALVEEGLKEYTEELFDLSKCDMGKKSDDFSVYALRSPTLQMESTPAGPSKSKTVASKAAHEPTPPTAPMGSTSAGPAKSKTVASKATHETPPATYQMESTPAGPSKSPSKLEAGMSKVKKVAKQLSPRKSTPHSASQAGPSHANPHPAPHMPSNPKTPTGTGFHRPPVPPDGNNGYSYIGSIPTLYIKKW